MSRYLVKEAQSVLVTVPRARRQGIAQNMKNSSLVHFKLLGYFNSKREEAMSAKDRDIIKLQVFIIASNLSFVSFTHLQLQELNYFCKLMGKGCMPATYC